LTWSPSSNVDFLSILHATMAAGLLSLSSAVMKIFQFHSSLARVPHDPGRVLIQRD
jgi:hypothetical protein